MRTIIKKIVTPFLQKASSFYLKKPRIFVFKDISVMVEPTVFPPFITISTKLLLEFIEALPLDGKKVLELGCGCGIISILAAKKGALVCSTDINQTALSALTKNAGANGVSIDIKFSDLFENLRYETFDYIIINPPYYPKTPKSIADSAWFCGDNFEYFERLFEQLRDYLSATILMILSEDCNIEKIKDIAQKNGMAFDILLEKKVAGERNYIFKIIFA
jgi:release factor glutamine methyltransferase